MLFNAILSTILFSIRYRLIGNGPVVNHLLMALNFNVNVIGLQLQNIGDSMSCQDGLFYKFILYYLYHERIIFLDYKAMLHALAYF